MGLFDAGDKAPISNHPPLPEISEWNEKQLLAFEKEALGFYITGHPLTRYREVMEKFTDADAISVQERSDGEIVRIGGIVTHTKTIQTKRGDLMAFVSLEDLNGSLEITVFSSVYAAVSDLLFDDNAVLVQGRLQKDENAIKMIADTVIPMDQAEEHWIASVYFNLDMGRTTRETLLELEEILKRHPGSCRAFLNLKISERVAAVVALSENHRIQAGDALKRDVNGFFGYRVVETVCSTAASAQTNGSPNGYPGRRKGRHG
jgi:DNA polymerase-3 subunit alpha